MFTLDKLLIIIVLYNEKLIDAAPLKSIELCNDLALYVYDNSLSPDLDANSYPNVTYIHDSRNPGVSSAYNSGVSFAKQIGREWVLLFDQDTILPADFLSKLQENINKLPFSNLYALRLLKEGNLISPCGYKYKRGYINNDLHSGNLSMNNISLLNSGLLISVELFMEAGGYDESVPLYFSDFVFVNRLRKIMTNFTLLPIDLVHNLSSNDMSDIKSFKIRYDLYLKGAKQAMASEHSGSLYYFGSTLLRAVKLSFTLKDRYYLKSFSRHILFPAKY